MDKSKKDSVRNPIQMRGQETKQRILQSGKALFASKGYDGTNSKEIAKQAGVSIGSFYAYFPDKGAVFREITESYYEKIFHHLEKLTKQESFGIDLSNAIHLMIQGLYLAHDIEPELHREISLMLLSGNKGKKKETHFLIEEIQTKVMELDKKVENWLMGILNLWQPSLKNKELTRAAQLLFRISEETIHRMKQFPESFEDHNQSLLDLERMILLYLKSLFQNKNPL